MTVPRQPTPPRTGRFVILAHHAPDGLHWDLMLEWDDALKTWSLSRQPDQYGLALEGTPLPDHRTLYLEYEGLISDGRGEVRRWDAGRFTLLDDTSGGLLLKLEGKRLAGIYSLTSL